MPGPVLTLIGSPSVARADGEPVTPQPGAKALALLAYLTLEPRPHTREALADLLWGESPEAEARASLRQALKQLRDSLGEVVHCDRRLVELAEPVRCDVTEFLAQAEPDPEAAAARRHPPVPRRVLHSARAPVRRVGGGDQVARCCSAT